MTTPYDGTASTNALVDPINYLPSSGRIMFGYGNCLSDDGRCVIPIYPDELRDYCELGTAAQMNAGDAEGDIPVLDSGGKLSMSSIPAGIVAGLSYQGVWNASTNSPVITSSVGTNGYFYRVSVAGNTIIDGQSSWGIGDFIIFDGSTWQKIDNNDAVSSVCGKIGAVTLTLDDLTETSTNKFYSADDKNKLASVQANATANSTDAQLRDRATHTGTQAISTISGLQTVLDSKISTNQTIALSGDITGSGSTAITAILANSGVSAGTYKNVTVDVKGRITDGQNYSFENKPSRSIVTTAAAANGFQVSSTRDSLISYSVTMTCTSSLLAGNQSGYVILEICSTNSSTAGDWTEVARSTNGQTGTLVDSLVLTQITSGQLGCVLQAGWFARLRSVNSVGTPSYTYNSGQEVLI